MQQPLTSSIRVVLTPEYQTTAPVHLFAEEAPLPPAEPAQQAAPDLELERSVIADLRSAETSQHERMLDELTAGIEVEAEVVARFERLGYPRDHVLLALSMVDAEDKIQSFCDNLRTLKDMQFETTAICGALVMTNNNIDQAINMLLNGP